MQRVLESSRDTQPKAQRAPVTTVSTPIAITGGDPSGIGPEVVEAWWSENQDDPNDYVFVGPPDWLTRMNAIRPIRGVEMGRTGATPGRPNLESARTTYACLESVAHGCKQGMYSSVVTGPVSKSWLARAGFPYPGQTEFFADRWGGEPTMAFAGGRMRVALVTWHIPLSEVPCALSKSAIIRTVRHAAILSKALAGLEEPRIGVCGLNPHAGEDGVIGREEQDFINPILAALKTDYPMLSECLPADSLFLRHMDGEFDVVIAMYHDQGLAPIKTVDFESSVNITLGLPYIRTSPDHGTAFALAGKREASCESFSNAVRLARLLLPENRSKTFPDID